MAAHDAAVDAAELSEGFMVEAKREATAAFAKYDADGSGAIDHEELFKVLMDKGHSKPGATPEVAREFLKVEFAKADTDGSGDVDFDEFVNFYVLICRYDEAEAAARTAFSRFHATNDNKIQK